MRTGSASFVEQRSECYTPETGIDTNSIATHAMVRLGHEDLTTRLVFKLIVLADPILHSEFVFELWKTLGSHITCRTFEHTFTVVPDSTLTDNAICPSQRTTASMSTESIEYVHSSRCRRNSLETFPGVTHPGLTEIAYFSTRRIPVACLPGWGMTQSTPLPFVLSHSAHIGTV